MTSFCVRMAETDICIHSVVAALKDKCQAYLTDSAAQIEITISEEDIVFERERADSPLSDSELAFLSLQRKLSDTLLDFGAIYFHGAAVCENGKAYLFTAPSGTGKTTHIRLWLKRYPDAHILNGDKPFLLIREGKILVCGAPWQGKENYGRNETVPLEAICILERGETDTIQKIRFVDGLEEIIRQMRAPKGQFVDFMALVAQMAEVKTYRLRCTMDEHAAEVSHRAMTGEG